MAVSETAAPLPLMLPDACNSERGRNLESLHGQHSANRLAALLGSVPVREYLDRHKSTGPAAELAAIVVARRRGRSSMPDGRRPRFEVEPRIRESIATLPAADRQTLRQ